MAMMLNQSNALAAGGQRANGVREHCQDSARKWLPQRVCGEGSAWCSGGETEGAGQRSRPAQRPQPVGPHERSTAPLAACACCTRVPTRVGLQVDGPTEASKTIIFNDEDHTLGNALRFMMMRE